MRCLLLLAALTLCAASNLRDRKTSSLLRSAAGVAKGAAADANYDPHDPRVQHASHEDTPFLNNVYLPQQEDVDVSNIDPNTFNMLTPKGECGVCQKFFSTMVFPRLAAGTPACQPKHIQALPKRGDGPALKGYCQLYHEQLHGDKRGSLEAMVNDMVAQHGADLGKCATPLAFDSCVDLGKCTETPCEVCQDKVHRASKLAFNTGYGGVLNMAEHLETMCNDASNPEIIQLRKALIRAAQQRAEHLNKYQSGYSKFKTKKIDPANALAEGIAHMVKHKSCESLSAVNNVVQALKDANIEWGQEEAQPENVKLYCASAGFCRTTDKMKQPSKCQILEESRTTDGKVHEGATETWVDHDVAKMLTYAYKARVTQEAQQTTVHVGTKDKAEEQKDTWVTAEVIVRTSGQPVDGLARFDMQVKDAQVGTYDEHNSWRAQGIEDTDLPYFFSRDAQGTVTAVHHDPSEKYFSLQLKHEIAKMFSTDLKGDEDFYKPSTSLVERGPGNGGGSVHSTHKHTVLLERTATHLVVRKTRSGISHHRVYAGQGASLATLHHRGESAVHINKDTKEIETSTNHDHVQTDSDEMLDDDKLGPTETCDPRDDKLCTPKKGGPRGESVNAGHEEGLNLVSRVVYPKNGKKANSIGNFLEISMSRMKTVPLGDDGHVPTRAEQQNRLHAHLNHPAAQLPTTQRHSDYVDYLLTNKTGDHDHRTFEKIVEVARHRPQLVQEMYERAAIMDGKQEDELAEYSRIVDVLAACGTATAQNALLSLLSDRRGKSQYQRHTTLNALGFTKYGAFPNVVGALENLTFGIYGAETAGSGNNIDEITLTDPVAEFAPLVLGTVVHWRHHIGHVDSNERGVTAELQGKLERHAQTALEEGHPKQHKLVWINSLGNAGRQSSLDILTRYLDAHRATADAEDRREHDNMVRTAVVMALRQVPGNRSEHLITSHLFDPSPMVRGAAANVYASSHRQAGEGTADLLHRAWLKERAATVPDAQVLSLLEKAKNKAGHASELDKPKNFLDEVHIPYAKEYAKDFGSEPNKMSLSAAFKLQFLQPYVNAKAGLVMHALGNDIWILGLGIMVNPVCVPQAGGKAKSKTRLVPYVIVFNQEIAIPLSKTEIGIKIGKCSKGDDSEPEPKTAKEIAAQHKKDVEVAKKAAGKNFKRRDKMGKEMKGKKVTKADKGESAGGVADVLTPVCGPVALQDVWSSDFTAPPAPLGRFMTALGPVLLTIKIEVSFDIGLEGNVGSCWGGDYEKKLAKKGNQCDAKMRIEEKKECIEDALEDVGVVSKKGLEGSWTNKPRGCSYRGGTTKQIYFNTHSTGGNDGKYAPICKVKPEDNKRNQYQFMAAIGPFFSIGLKVTASVGYPFILEVSVAMKIDFFKLQPVTTLTVSNGEDQTKDRPSMISAADFYVHLLAGSVQVAITFLPDILDFEIVLIKVQFPGPDGKYACVSSALNPKLVCPDEYFINAPGGPHADAKLTLSEFPVSMWCTKSPKQETMCPWSEGRKSEEDMAADRSLDLARGKCKQAYHCQNKDFDGYVMGKDETIETSGTKIVKLSAATFRDKNNYRPDQDHQNIAYSKKFGTELVAGVERPIQSYVLFDVVRQVSCGGGHDAKSCNKCPKDWCQGDCTWNSEQCVLKSSAPTPTEESCGRIAMVAEDGKTAYIVDFGRKIGHQYRNGAVQSVMVSGSTAQPGCMGEYVWTGSFQGGKPAYKKFGDPNGANRYLYWYPSQSRWYVGHTLGASNGLYMYINKQQVGTPELFSPSPTPVKAWGESESSWEWKDESITVNTANTVRLGKSCTVRLGNDAPVTSVGPCPGKSSIGTSSIRKATLRFEWCKYPGKSSGHYAAGVSTAYPLAGAQKKCNELGESVCPFVTCQSNGLCTVRASTTLKTYAPETSWGRCPTYAIEQYVAEGVSKSVPEFASCTHETPLSFWARTDTYGHVAMGTGSKVGVNTLLQWKDPDPIKWVHRVGVGGPDVESNLKFSNVEANRGSKDEVYCTPTNTEEDPEAKGFNDLGDCYRKMPDSYFFDTGPLHVVRTNPQNAPQLQCNKGNSFDPDFESCISGVCRDFGVNVLRCAGCKSDKDCGKRTYVGTDCNAPGSRVVVKQSDGYVWGGVVQDFDTVASSKGWGAPNNGKINVRYGKTGKTEQVDRSRAFACATVSSSYDGSAGHPPECKTSCAISGEQCPLEQPSSPGMESAACWDGSHKKGNRHVCVFEEREWDDWGPRKYYCRASGYIGAWCDTDAHCGVECPAGTHPYHGGSHCCRVNKNKQGGPIQYDDTGCEGNDAIECPAGAIDGACKNGNRGTGSVCSLWRCSRPKKDMELCGRDVECTSGSCAAYYGTDKRCKPTGGWADHSRCVHSHDCKSKSCVTTYLTDAHCKPTGGFRNGFQCFDKHHSHCASGYCSFKIPHKCAPKKADYEGCHHHNGHQACISGSCKEVETGKPICRPKAGWADYKQCYSGRDNECKSKSCRPVRLRAGLGDLAYCKPSGGFKDKFKCYGTRHGDCKSGMCKGLLDGAYCATCSTGITRGKAFTGTCVWGCCWSDGTMAPYNWYWDWGLKADCGYHAPSVSCPANTYPYHKGSHCCRVNKNKQGGLIQYEDTGCKGDDAIECPAGAIDGACRPGNQGGGCPAGTYPYHGGSHCCRVNKNKQGGPVQYEDSGCHGNNFIECPAGAIDGACKNGHQGGKRPHGHPFTGTCVWGCCNHDGTMRAN